MLTRTEKTEHVVQLINNNYNGYLTIDHYKFVAYKVTLAKYR